MPAIETIQLTAIGWMVAKHEVVKLVQLHVWRLSSRNSTLRAKDYLFSLQREGVNLIRTYIAEYQRRIGWI
jgi:hypothetical protein